MPRSRYVLRKRAMSLWREGKPVRVVIGAGSRTYEGWLNTDLPVFNALRPAHWRSIFPPGSIDRILAEHVIEHWPEADFLSFLKNVRPFLSNQGVVRIAVPDGFHPDPDYIEFVRPGGSGIGAADHKVLYDQRMIENILSKAHYDYKLLEYYDEGGQFHRLPWDPADGFIERSADFGHRNKKVPLSYTSLIVDTWPGR